MGSPAVLRQPFQEVGRKPAKKVSKREEVVLAKVSAAQDASSPSRVSSRSRISSKGQLTVPMQVRERLGVGPGDEVEFFFDGERTIVKPVRLGDPFAKWVGIGKGVFKDDAELLAWERDLRGRDEWDEEHYK